MAIYVLTLKKKAVQWYVLRGQCCPSGWVWQPSADSIGSLAHYFLIWTSWVRYDSPGSADNNGCCCSSNLKKSASNGYYYLQRAVTPDQITQQNSLHRAEGHKVSKGTLKSDFQANTRPRTFLKPVSPQDSWDSCEEIQLKTS